MSLSNWTKIKITNRRTHENGWSKTVVGDFVYSGSGRGTDWFFIADITKNSLGLRSEKIACFGPRGAKLNILWSPRDEQYVCIENGIEGSSIEDLIANFIPHDGKETDNERADSKTC